MEQPVAVGLGPAEGAFPLHGADAAGAALVRRPPRRSQGLALLGRLEPCLAGHGGARRGAPLGARAEALGPEVRLTPPAHAKPCAERGRTDRADAGAIAEAATRPALDLLAGRLRDLQARADVVTTRIEAVAARTTRSPGAWPPSPAQARSPPPRSRPRRRM